MTTPAHHLAVTRMFLRPEDVDSIIRLVSSLPSYPIIADIGAGSGTTALSILAANPRSEIHTIDISAENVDWAKLAIDAYYYAPYWEGIVSDSVKAAELFHDDTFHMVLLDTSHEYKATKREIEAWLPKLMTGGIFWFHDYVDSEVDKAVDEAVAAGQLELIEAVGLGWAGKKL